MPFKTIRALPGGISLFLTKFIVEENSQCGQGLGGVLAFSAQFDPSSPGAGQSQDVQHAFGIGFSAVFDDTYVRLELI
jgi:hypothetical protein